MAGGGGRQTTRTEPPKFMKPFLEYGAQEARDAYDYQKGVPVLPDYDVLGPFSPLELHGQQNMLAGAQAGQPLVNRALNAQSRMVNPYADPAARTALAGLNKSRQQLNQVYRQGGGQLDFRRVDPGWDIKHMMRDELNTAAWQPALDEVERRGMETFTNQMMPALRGEFGGAGQYGSERHAAFAGDAATKALREISGAQAGMLSQAALDASANRRAGAEAALGLGRLEEQALARRTGDVLRAADIEGGMGASLYPDLLKTGVQAQALAPQTLGMTQWGPGIQSQVGGMQRGRDEIMRQQDLERYLAERGHGLDEVAQYMAALGGSGINLGGVTTQSGRGSPLAGMIGGGMAGAGVVGGLGQAGLMGAGATGMLAAPWAAPAIIGLGALGGLFG